MTNRIKLYSMALILTAMIFMLVSIADAAPFAYITNHNSNNVSVIDTAKDVVTATVNVGSLPWGTAVTPDGTKIYVANWGSNTVSIIDMATNTVSATVNVGSNPFVVAITPDGTNIYWQTKVATLFL